MAQIDISARILGDKELSAALARLSSHDIPKAIREGVRVAARGGRTTMSQQIGQHYTLTAGRIKQDITQPSFRNGGQEAIISTSRKPITAMQFKPKQLGKGISVAIYKGERTVVKSGFMQHSNAGTFPGTLPFKPNPGRRYRGDINRSDGAGWQLKPRAKPRAGMDTVKGPSIHAIYTGGKYAKPIQQATQQRIEEQLVNGIMQGLRKVGAGYIK